MQRFAGEQGSIIVMDCVVRARPFPTFLWTFNGQNLTHDGRRMISSSGNKSQLEIDMLQESDYGTYNCHAANSAGINSFPLELENPGKKINRTKNSTNNYKNNS